MFREHANVVPRSRLFNDESSSPHDDINYHLSRIMKNQFKTFHPERYQTNDYPDPDLSNDESSEEDFFFLEKALKESAELDDVDRRLLVGII